MFYQMGGDILIMSPTWNEYAPKGAPLGLDPLGVGRIRDHEPPRPRRRLVHLQLDIAPECAISSCKRTFRCERNFLAKTRSLHSKPNNFLTDM